MVESQNIEGTPEIVLETLDSLLYNDKVVSGQTHLKTDRESLEMNRSFSYLDGDANGLAWPLTEITVDIAHEIDKRHGAEYYTVELGWKIQRADIDQVTVLSKYLIAKWGESHVQGYLQTSGVIANRIDECPMTPYDYEQLFDDLGSLHDLQAAEDRDNALGQAF